MNKYLFHLISFAFLSCFTTGVMANEPAESKFNRLYGKEKKDVLRSREAEDDLELARELIDQAKGIHDDPAFRKVLFFEAYEIAKGEILKGYNLAAEAMIECAKADPLLALEAKQKEVDMWVQLMRRAPGRGNKAKVAAIAAGKNLFLIAQTINDGRFKQAADRTKQGVSLARTARSNTAQTVYRELSDILTAQRKAQSRIVELRKLIIAEPKNAPKYVDEMIAIQLTELNDADRAVRYASFAGSKEFVDITRLASRDPGTLKADQALYLAKWYEQYHRSTSKAAQLISLIRSLNYYEQYLVTQEPGSIEYLEQERSADKIRDLVLEKHEFTRRVVMSEPLPEK